MKSLKFRITTAVAAVALTGVTVIGAMAGEPSQAQQPTEDDTQIVYAGGFGLFPSN